LALLFLLFGVSSTSGLPLSVPLIEALKASAVPIAFGELYTALTTNLVDVQDNSLSIFRLIRLQEVHKFILLSGHSYAVGVLGINNAFYIQLSPDERAAVDAAALKAIAFNREGSRKAEQEAIAALRTAGVELTQLPLEQNQEFQRVSPTFASEAPRVPCELRYPSSLPRNACTEWDTISLCQ
jgi:TRAP-type C4-dicarboxylate transport system substrate-binding protein